MDTTHTYKARLAGFTGISDKALGDIVIFGAGGMGREVRQIIERINVQEGRARCLGFLVDEGFSVPSRVDGLPVVVGLDGLAAMPKAALIVAVGDPAARRRIIGRVQARFRNPFVSLVDPRATCGDPTAPGPGSVVAAGAVITSNVVIGDHVIVNVGATVSHDVRLSNFATLAPGVHIAGSVNIGEGVELGIGCSVIPRINIGAWATVGAGAVVTKDVPPNATVVGVPARVVQTRPAGWHASE